MTLDAALKLGMKAMSIAIGVDVSPDSIEIGVIEVGKKFKRLQESDIAKYVPKG